MIAPRDPEREALSREYNAQLSAVRIYDAGLDVLREAWREHGFAIRADDSYFATDEQFCSFVADLPAIRERIEAAERAFWNDPEFYP